MSEEIRRLSLGTVCAPRAVPPTGVRNVSDLAENRGKNPGAARTGRQMLSDMEGSSGNPDFITARFA